MINLRTRTEYSFRYAFGHLQTVLSATTGPLAICDRGGTHGHAQFELAMKKAERKPIFGVELAVVLDPTERTRKGQRVSFLGFLARDARGLEEIYGLTTLACEQFYYQPRVSWSDVHGLSDDVFIFSGANPDWSQLPPQAYIELNPSSSPVALSYALEFELTGQLIATSDNLFPRPSDRPAYQIIAGRTVDNRVTKSHIISDDYEWMSIFKQRPWALDDETLEQALWMSDRVAAHCNVELPKATMVSFEPKESLEALCIAAAPDRGVDLADPVYLQRLQRELALITEKNYEDYFLVIWDMLQFAHQRMLVGPARGSAAGSLVCYLLSITQIDPIPHNLLFERFIDINRDDLPDIDIDFPDDRRDEIFSYVTERYGSDCVARLGTVSRYKARSTIAEVAKALNIPPWEVADLKDSIIERSPGDERASFCISDTFTNLEAGQKALKEHPELIIAAELEGHARHSGQHAAGIIILSDPVQRFAGVDRVGAVMADKKDAEVLSFLKIDALGLRTLSVIQDCLDQIGWERDKIINWPIEDEVGFRVLNDQRYAGIFQYEGYALQSLASQVTVETFNDMAALTALARPGPLQSGGAAEFIKRRAGKTDVRYIHPMMKDITEPTLGIIIYQEQMMQIARTIGQLSWADVSQLRKGLSKSLGVEFFDRYWENFKKGAKLQGIHEETSRQIWEQINTMGAYAFNRSHAVAYALVSYWCCILKGYHPLEFASACLRHSKDDDQTVRLLREITEEGHDYVSFDPEKIQPNWFVEDGKIYGGLSGIKGIGPQLTKDIIERISNGDELTPRQTKLIENASTPYDTIYPGKQLWGDLKKNPTHYGIATTITDLGDIKEGGLGGIFMVVARMTKRVVKDANKEGIETSATHTRWLNMTLEDDSGSLMATVPRSEFPVHGEPMVEDASLGDWFMIKGRIPTSHRRLYVQRVRKLEKIDGEISLQRAVDGHYEESSPAKMKG